MENKQKQTAVEWLFNELRDLQFLFENDKIGAYVYVDRKLFIKNKAKEMEKQQNKEWFEKGYKSGIADYIDIQNGYDGKAIGFEKHYNEEYAKTTNN